MLFGFKRIKQLSNALLIKQHIAMANISRKAGTNSSKKESKVKMVFTDEQIEALEALIKTEISNKMLMDKIKGLRTDIEHLIEKDGWQLSTRIANMVNTNDAFTIEQPEPLLPVQPVPVRVQPVPDPDANHVDDPEQSF